MRRCPRLSRLQVAWESAQAWLAPAPAADAATLLQPPPACMLRPCRYLGPYVRRAFQPLVDAGFLEVCYGGGPLGKYLCNHPGIASGAPSSCACRRKQPVAQLVEAIRQHSCGLCRTCCCCAAASFPSSPPHPSPTACLQCT